MFQCPNCRAYTDLSAEVDDTNDTVENDAPSGPPSARDHPVQGPPAATTLSRAVTAQEPISTTAAATSGDVLAAAVSNMSLSEVQAQELTANQRRTPNMDIPNQRQTQPGEAGTNNRSDLESPGIGDTFEDCPLTPRNDLGPLALDGRAGHL
jgi:hypothetical protein